MNRKKLYMSALRQWGEVLQVTMVLEETAELQQAIGDALFHLLPDPVADMMNEIAIHAAKLRTVAKEIRGRGPEDGCHQLLHPRIKSASCPARGYITEEMADVRIMLEQLELVLGNGRAVRHAMREKIDRLRLRLQEVREPDS